MDIIRNPDLLIKHALKISIAHFNTLFQGKISSVKS